MKKVHKFCVLAGVTLVGMLVLSMFMGAWVAGAAPVTPTVGIAPALEFSIPSTAAITAIPGTSQTNVLAVTVKSNAAWTVTVSTGGLLTSGLNTIPSSYFTLTTTATGATGVTNLQYPTIAGTCLSGARGTYLDGQFTYKVDLTPAAAWLLEVAANYTCSHTYTASN
ncbi:MAG: hypothetical protein KKB90_11560 [Actinobacteria bacterium]|nr:hypothetical protein [Actinomycetota bacterium]MCG2818258.1 hypothetical protein [Actinomycetes bacterium]MBU4219582.1 hypothetical protein [Actinomycetota bacterium]MBU4358795.1 hypothetical protein [Actinomycetota bacterium]MBU4391436.1 hypothetical protein [Actinomycetota bacterium]